MRAALEVRFSPPASAEPSDCRKCGLSLGEQRACPRCGLAVDRADAWASRNSRPITELMRAWTATVAHWEEPAAHDRVAAVALRREALPWLARRYREVERARPDDAVVRPRLERIGALTLSVIRATQTPAASSFLRRTIGAAVIAFLLVLVAGTMFSARRSSAQSGRRRPAPSWTADRVRVHRALAPDHEGKVPRPPRRGHVD